MEGAGLVFVAAAVYAWGVLSGRLERADVTAPVFFVVVGALLHATGLVHADLAPETFTPLVEVTLVWVLFADAARVRAHELRTDVGLVVRLLAIGLPLSVLAGWGLAAGLFSGMGGWLALLVGAALAPTDAALGLPVVTNPVVPARVRRVLTVESGLNDGIVTPIVVVAIAGAASSGGHSGGALRELVVGVAVGAGIGYGGGWFLQVARRRGWTAADFVGVALLALALLAYTASLAVDGNGFVAAFCGGIAFGAAADRLAADEVVFIEQASGAVSLLVWLAFGAVAVPIVLDRLTWSVLAYAVLSLTVVRMLPVAVALVRGGLDRRTVAFVAWFGPRGLASLVFALLALEELGSAADQAVAVIGVTVFLSVLAHGFSAAPLAARYGRAVAAGPRPTEGAAAAADLPVRRLPGSRGSRTAA